MSTINASKSFSNTFSNTLGTLAVAGLLCASTVASADIFVDIPGIPGGSNSAAFPDTIEALGATGNFSGAGCGVFTLVKEIDESSPQLIADIVNKRFAPSVDIIYTADTLVGPFEYFRMTLKNVRIARLQSMTNNDTNQLPTEQVNLRAAAVDITYTEQDRSGNKGDVTTTTVQCQSEK